MTTTKLPRRSKVPLHGATCDFCGTSPDEIIDAPTIHGGRWAHMCKSCFRSESSMAARQGVIGTLHTNGRAP